jgi:hypothetical protein
MGLRSLRSRPSRQQLPTLWYVLFDLHTAQFPLILWFSWLDRIVLGASLPALLPLARSCFLWCFFWPYALLRLRHRTYVFDICDRNHCGLAPAPCTAKRVASGAVAVHAACKQLHHSVAGCNSGWDIVLNGEAMEKGEESTYSSCCMDGMSSHYNSSLAPGTPSTPNIANSVHQTGHYNTLTRRAGQ